MAKSSKRAVREQNLERLRRLCLALPEAHEKEAWGDPTFRVKDKIFAMHKEGDGRPSVWCKSDPFERDALVEHDPEAYYVPPYVGHKGWIGVRLDHSGVDWDSVGKIVTQSYRLIAPKRLATQIRGAPKLKR
ncbi:MAG TPA: MmcQ/YjbR family DNA-binding protein [Polyangiaceae bacterium]|nr:MmcQ/YjbR family DNA-binding protein [Polyangiaceae bacterium]